MTLYGSRSSNIRKTWLIFSLFLIICVAVGWGISYYFNDPTILYIAVAFSFLMNIVAYWKSDSIALSLNKARKADETQYIELHRIVQNLCITAGIPKPKVYIINDDSPNAFATGRNPQHAAIAVTTGLLSRLDRSELEGVIAHELSHIQNYDTLLQTVVVVLVGFIAIASDIFLRSMHFSKGNSRNNNQGNLLIIVGIIFIILSPIAAKIIQLAISRKREFLADASGALLTRYPEGLAHALEKISSAQPLKRARNATAHLFFVNPLKADSPVKRKTGFFARLFMTHPPIEERIRALLQEA